MHSGTEHSLPNPAAKGKPYDCRQRPWGQKTRDEFSGYSIQLRELLDLVGLGDLAIVPTRLPRQVSGKTEDGEQVGVEEVVMPDDSLA
jgi:hypothetical protein